MCTSSFYRSAKISVLATHSPSIDPAEDKPYSSRPCGGMSEAWNCFGWERGTFSPPWQPTRQTGLPPPEPTAQCRTGSLSALPRARCRSSTGAAGSGLAWGSTFRFWFNCLLFWLLRKNGSIFLKDVTFREKSLCTGEFKCGVIYLILSSLHGSWALYPN